MFSLGFVSLLLLAVTPALAAQLTLTWTDTSSNEAGFKIERATGSAGTYGQLAAVGADTTGYVDSTVTAGTTFCYRVRAYNGAGDSAASNPACATPVGATLYTVAVTKSGTGSGTVTSSPSGIDCGGTCSAPVVSGTSLALSATPTTGSTFSGWSGACIGTGSCALVADNDKRLTATFALNTQPTYSLTLAKSGTGSGTVTSSPDGISCGSDCAQNYTSGTSVTLAATPATGATFTGWSGACAGTSATCAVTMDRAKSVMATFDTTTSTQTTTYTLTVRTTGNAKGTVASSPNGIACGRDCSERYTAATTVTLTATPATGATFTGWGGACAGTGPCTVTLNGSKGVTASFTKGRR